MTRNDFTLAPMISDKARRYFEENFSRSIRDAMQVPAPDNMDGWEKHGDLECKEQETRILEFNERYAPTLIEIEVGDGLVAATTLNVRDRGHGLLASMVVWSPWVDLSCIGDSHITIREEETFYQKDVFLMNAALAYAPQAEHTHPYASPIYADYSQGFPPTLSQAGSREILLSDSIPFYQALDLAGQSVQLDLYDGMWHLFQFFPIEGPEAIQARSKTCEYIHEHFRNG